MAVSSGRVSRSAARELTPSFRKTLRICHSTVRGLMNIRAPISGFDRPLPASRRDLALLSRELVARLNGALAGRLAGRA